MLLHPFWKYYGSKYREAVRYPYPKLDTIIEPFAGSAGYSLRYPDRNIILIEKYHVIAEVWKFLISSSKQDIMSIPLVESTDDLPRSLPTAAKWLVGFNLRDSQVSPGRNLSSGVRKLQETGRKLSGWSEHRRLLICNQVEHIRHWRVIEGNYSDAPDVKATWFIDPPYNKIAGSAYIEQVSDYRALGRWCRSRLGQVIVCESYIGTWLPFKPFGVFKNSINGTKSSESIWYRPESEDLDILGRMERLRISVEKSTSILEEIVG